METRHLTCIQCPIGCQLTIDIDGEIDKETGLAKDIDKVTVTGNNCPRGAIYGAKEVTFPTRIVTSTVTIDNGTIPMVSVKTDSDIPKGKIFDIVQEIKNVKISAPVHIGDVIIADVASTGVNVVATKEVLEK